MHSVFRSSSTCKLHKFLKKESLEKCSSDFTNNLQTINSDIMMSSINEAEAAVLTELLDRIKDLTVDHDYLEPKNLVRFIRARNGVLSKAEEMIRRNVEWMETWGVKTLVVKYTAPSGWDEALPFSITGFNYTGGPVAVLPLGRWDPTVVVGMREEFIRRSICGLEKAWRLMKSKSRNKDVMVKATVIVDLEGLCRKHYTHYDGVYGVAQMFRYFEANYPEALLTAYVIHYPFIASLFWKLLKPLLSPATHEKIEFLSSGDRNLWKEKIMKDCDDNQFTVTYGGTLPAGHNLDLDELYEISEGKDQNGNN